MHRHLAWAVLALLVTLGAAGIFFGAPSALADTLGIDDASEAAEGLRQDLTAIGILGTIVDFLLGLVGLLALLALIWGGVMMILGLGNESRVEHAKKIIFWAVAGLIVVGLAWTIINLVANKLLGVNI